MIDHDKLYQPLAGETEEIKKEAKKELRIRYEPFEKQKRDVIDGPRLLNSALSCREDIYAIAFLY